MREAWHPSLSLSRGSAKEPAGSEMSARQVCQSQNLHPYFEGSLVLKKVV